VAFVFGPLSLVNFDANTFAALGRRVNLLSTMKQFVKDDNLIHISGSGPVKAAYVALLGERHIIKWMQGKNTISDIVGDDSVFPDSVFPDTKSAYGLRCAIDAEIERRYENALADMKAGNPTSTHLVRTHQIIAA
jgi:hypothetical protein